MASYRFQVAAPFGRTRMIDLPVNAEEEVELVRAFMLRLAPEMARTSLRSDISADDNAQHTLYWAMQLTAKFTAFKREALKAIKNKDSDQEGE